MTSYVEALHAIRTAAADYHRASEPVSLDKCVGRKTAYEVESSWILPAFDTSAMDGYAIRAEETVDASVDRPLTFTVAGALAAGDLPTAGAQTKQVWEIMTGAPFPEGYDACVRQEDVTRHANTITLTKPVPRNNNRRLAGEDFRVGSTVVEAGHTIRPVDVLCFAALGITEIEVYKKLRVAIIATGKELVGPTEIPRCAQIRNSTTPYLKLALAARGAEVIHTSHVGDDPQDFLKQVDANRGADVILTTGAISVGKYDFVVKALETRGLQTHFQKVRIRPGKPLLFGRLGPEGPFVMGLPGNPVATATGFRFFVEPLLRALDNEPQERAIQATLTKPTHKAKDATSFLKATLTQTPTGAVVEAQENQKASMTNVLTKSNAWIALGEAMPEDIAAGTLVDVYPLI